MPERHAANEVVLQNSEQVPDVAGLFQRPIEHMLGLRVFEPSRVETGSKVQAEQGLRAISPFRARLAELTIVVISSA
jgi:hypothetical protein